MKDTNQIAAEARHQIFNCIHFSATERQERITDSLIQSAIEKATEPILSQLEREREITRKLAKDKRRATHASEPRTRYDAVHDRVIGAAHASEHPNLRAQLKKEGLPQDHIDQIIDGMNKDRPAHASEQFPNDVPISGDGSNLPPELIKRMNTPAHASENHESVQCGKCGEWVKDFSKHRHNDASEQGAEQLAVTFHNIYERLAPDFGYETRKETRDFDAITPNGRLMIAVCGEILKYHLPRAARASEPFPKNQEEMNAIGKAQRDALESEYGKPAHESEQGAEQERQHGQH